MADVEIVAVAAEEAATAVNIVEGQQHLGLGYLVMAASDKGVDTVM